MYNKIYLRKYKLNSILLSSFMYKFNKVNTRFEIKIRFKHFKN